MSITLVRPAPFYDLLEMASADNIPPAARKVRITPQAIARIYPNKGRSWGLFDGAVCIACMGLFPDLSKPDGTPRFEAWFFARPGARHHMLAIARLAQLTAKAASEDGPVELFARVALRHRAGERLAAAIGCKKSAEEGGYGIWIYGS